MRLHKAESISGTCLQGYVTITYAELVAALGEPHMTYGDKTTAEWAFQYGDAVFTIYDYKEDRTPTGVYSWHLGGFDSSILPVVQALFPNNLVRSYRS
jgi:hypothetical protein